MVAEFELLARLQGRLDADGPGRPRGVGDDAAVLEVASPVVIAVDTLVDGVHADRRFSSLADLGFKAMAVNCSDLAAMGALPTAAVVALTVPEAESMADLERCYDGLREAADRWGVAIVGGDTVSGPALSVSVTALGRLAEPDRVLRRDTAEVGDLVAVVGPLGLAAAGLALLQAGAEDVLAAHPELAAAHRRPTAPVEAVEPLVLAGVRTAIDVSDGLGRDLGHVAADSGVGIRLDRDRLPVAPGVRAAAERLGRDPLDLVVGGGEDQALAVTVAPARLGRLDLALQAAGLHARVVGEVVDGDGVWLDGRSVADSGWEHGQAPS